MLNGFAGFISNCTLAKNIESLKKVISFVWVFIITFCFSACQNGIEAESSNRFGAIVLGDSATIVTETDTNFLKNNVADLEPQELVQTLSVKPENQEPAAQIEAEKELPSTPTASTNEPVFTINFGRGVLVTFTGITTRTFRKQDPEKDAGVSYAVVTGELSESVLKITGIKNLKVRQRYQTYLFLQSDEEELSLRNMGGYLSDWKILPANTSSFSLEDLKNLNFKSVSYNTIRTATSRAARTARLSSQKTNFWLQKIRKTRSANDEPCLIKLDNVQWQVSGQASDGRSFFKTIRLDAKR